MLNGPTLCSSAVAVSDAERHGDIDDAFGRHDELEINKKLRTRVSPGPGITSWASSPRTAALNWRLTVDDTGALHTEAVPRTWKQDTRSPLAALLREAQPGRWDRSGST